MLGFGFAAEEVGAECVVFWMLDGVRYRGGLAAGFNALPACAAAAAAATEAEDH